MDDAKKCSKCKTIALKCNFNKDGSTRDGLNPICKVCRLRYFYEKRENKNFILACNIRSRTNQAFKSQNAKNL